MNHLFSGMMDLGGGMQMPNNRPRSAGCSNEFIRNLPAKEAGKESDCYICLDKCKEGKDSCQLSCSHAFCRECLTNWLKEHDSCPVCRIKLDQNRARAQPEQAEQANMFFF